MDVARPALDPTIAALADFAASLGPTAPQRVVHVAPGVVAFADDPRLVSAAVALFLGCCAMMAASMQPQPRQTAEQARGARNLAYLEGAVRPPRRQTLRDRVQAEARAWGLA